jgi:hypothetical protein
MHGIEQPFVTGDQRLAGLLGQGQISRIVGAALEAPRQHSIPSMGTEVSIKPSN